MKVAFHTLGCKLNFAETASIERSFIEAGHTVSDFSEQSDVCVINTCAVTTRATKECRQIIRRVLRKAPGTYVVIIGCYSQLEPEEIASIDGVDLVLGTAEKFSIEKHAGDFVKNSTTRIVVSPIKESNDFGPAYSGSEHERTRAFLKIQDGCDFTCTFCTIPLARGSSRSQPAASAVDQAKKLVDAGYKEIILTGVNVGDFGKNSGSSLTALLQSLHDINGLERIRISSIEPNLLRDDLLELWADAPKICKHFHIPLQSAHNELLKSMRRRYSLEDFTALIGKIRTILPIAGIGVDVIVGFPGETEKIFEAEYEYLRQLPASYFHVFTYSERPNTPSLGLPERVDPRIRYHRSALLRNLSNRKKQLYAESFIGKTLPVLMERRVDKMNVSGYTDTYVYVRVETEEPVDNLIVPVTLTEKYQLGCKGKISLSYAMPQ